VRGEQPEHFPIGGREDHCDQRTGIFERLARVGQFDLLKPVGGENGDAQSIELVIHRGPS
jgi:hypothetical protein